MLSKVKNFDPAFEDRWNKIINNSIIDEAETNLVIWNLFHIFYDEF